MQHGRYGWQGSHRLRYDNYLISSSYDLNEAAALAYEESLLVGKRPMTDYRKKEQNQTYVKPEGARITVRPNKESQSESTSAGRSKSAEAPDWKITDARIPLTR